MLLTVGPALGLAIGVWMSESEKPALTRVMLSAAWAAAVVAVLTIRLAAPTPPPPDVNRVDIEIPYAETMTDRELAASRHVRNGGEPWLVLALSVFPPIGAVGGLLASLIASRAPLPTLLGGVLWCVAFTIGGVFGWVAYYLAGALATDLLESIRVSARIGKVVGAFGGGMLTGYVVSLVGQVASLVTARDDKRPVSLFGAN